MERLRRGGGRKSERREGEKRGEMSETEKGQGGRKESGERRG